MTGFETATLAFHAASLGWQEVSAWATVGGVAIGIAQCLLIAWGLRLMQQNASARDAGIAAGRVTDDQRHAEAMQAHAETMQAHADSHAEAMRALEALIARTAPTGTNQ